MNYYNPLQAQQKEKQIDFYQLQTNSQKYINLQKMISKNIALIFTLFIVLTVSDICDAPQKQFYLSYQAISNRDYLANMFQQISQNFPKYNVTYTDKNGSVYQIIDFTPHMFYNQHRQTQAYHDQYSVNVTLGQLYMAYRFNFLIKHQNKNVSGSARGQTLVDQTSFLKKIVILEGALEWDPVQIPVLDINSQFSVQYSNPKFTQDQMAIYIQLLNDYLGTQKLKQNVIKQANILFALKLRNHLNHEDILKNASISYNYNNINLNYTNVIRDFKMNNAQTKGLQVFLLFGLQEGKQQCIDLPKQFDQASYGGVQEIISMGTIRNTVQQAARQGLFDVTLDKKYQVPYFQFYMGDLGNFVQYANKLPAHDPFTVKCMFAVDRINQLKISRYDEHDIYVQVPEDCTISYKDKVVMKVTMDMNLVVRVVAENNSLNTVIYNVGIYGDKYFAIDSNFVVTDPYTAKYALTAVLNGLIGKNVFGTGWATISRKYPVVRVVDDYIVIFDASQK